MAGSIYAIGETIYDIIFTNGEINSGKTGGSVVNCSVSLGRLGLPINLISDFGADALGDIIATFLFENGVSAKYVDRKSNPRTAVALAHIGSSGDATYSFYRDNNKITNDLHPQFGSDDIVIFGSMYALETAKRENLITLLKSAKKAGALIYYDPNVRDKNAVEENRHLYMENISYADIVRGSDEDFKALFNVNCAIDAHKAVGKNILYTCREGVNEFVGNSVYAKAPTRKVEVVSTVGAGDNFNAGFIASIYRSGVNCDNISAKDPIIWESAISTGVEFASAVCASYDNYIPFDLAKRW